MAADVSTSAAGQWTSQQDGSTVELVRGPGGGPCGEWVERDGTPVIELTGYAVDPRTTE